MTEIINIAFDPVIGDSATSGYQDVYHPKYPDIQVTGVLTTPVRVSNNGEVPGYDCSAPKNVRISSE